MSAITFWNSRRPLDLGAATARYVRLGHDPVNVVAGRDYYRVTAVGTPYRARQLPSGAVEIVTPGSGDDAAADLAHRLAENLPAAPLEDLAGRDARVGRLLAGHPGYRPPLVVDPFEALVTAISAQQINLEFATRVRARLIRRLGTARRLGSVTVWEFPAPQVLAQADPDELHRMQFTRRKAEYLVGVAAAACEGLLDGLDRLSDAEVIERVATVRGIGRWSAEWLLARCLARPAAVAAGDLGVQKAVGLLYLGLGRRATEAEVREAAAHWGDAANWVTHLLVEEMAAP